MKETAITLSSQQRNLLLEYEFAFEDRGLFRLVSVSRNIGGSYIIFMNESQLESLMDQVSKISDAEHTKKLHDDLIHLSKYLTVCYNNFDENKIIG